MSELYHFNPNHDELGRFAKKSGAMLSPSKRKWRRSLSEKTIKKGDTLYRSSNIGTEFQGGHRTYVVRDKVESSVYSYQDFDALNHGKDADVFRYYLTATKNIKIANERTIQSAIKKTMPISLPDDKFMEYYFKVGNSTKVLDKITNDWGLSKKDVVFLLTNDKYGLSQIKESRLIFDFITRYPTNAQKDIFKSLQSDGYGAMDDINDQSRGVSSTATVIFNNKDLMTTKVEHIQQNSPEYLEVAKDWYTYRAKQLGMTVDELYANRAKIVFID